jgi:H+-transporting ATPase
MAISNAEFTTAARGAEGVKASIPKVLESLNVRPDEGLSSLEARSRLDKYGPNAIEEKRKSAIAAFLGYFWGPIPWMIEAAALMALIVKDGVISLSSQLYWCLMPS